MFPFVVGAYVCRRTYGDFKDLIWSLTFEMGNQSVALPELPPQVPAKKQNQELWANRTLLLSEVIQSLQSIPMVSQCDSWLDFVDEPEEDWAAVLVQNRYQILPD